MTTTITTPHIVVTFIYERGRGGVGYIRRPGDKTDQSFLAGDLPAFKHALELLHINKTQAHAWKSAIISAAKCGVISSDQAMFIMDLDMSK